jgi:hypothetical protein
MEPVSNKLIVKIFCDYTRGEEYAEAYKKSRNEQDIETDNIYSRIEKALSPEDYRKIVDDIMEIAYFREELGFINGFKYASRLASEAFTN